MKNVMYKVRIYNALDLVKAVTEFEAMCGRRLDEIDVDTADMFTAIEETLTDGSKVYNIELGYVGPDVQAPTV